MRTFTDAMRSRAGTLAMVVFVAGALAIPFTLGPNHVEQITAAMITSVALLGLTVVTGLTGQISLAHSAFIGTGAYTTAVLASHHGWSPIATAPVAAFACFLLGIALGVPALRVHGPYLGLVTLAVSVIFPSLVRRHEDLTGGSRGLRVPSVEPPSGVVLAADQWRYLLVLGVAVLAVVAVRNLTRSRTGRAFVCVRDDELAAEVSGVDVKSVKVVAFGLSAMFAGLAGTMNAALVGAVAPEQFGVIHSVSLLAGVVIGGATSLAGAFIGGFALEFLPQMSSAIDPNLAGVLYGGALVCVMLAAPGGVTSLSQRIRRGVKRHPRDARAAADATDAGERAAPHRDDGGRSQDRLPISPGASTTGDCK